MKSANIVYYNNGVGLKKDVYILKKYLSDFTCTEINIEKMTCYNKGDINIFIQDFDPERFPYGCKNYIYLNQEWIYENYIPFLNDFDGIFVKSNYAKSEVEKYTTTPVINTAFASLDRFNKDIIKCQSFFHLAGKSIQKNTELVIEAFNKNKKKCTIIDGTQRFENLTESNIDYIKYYLSDTEIDHYMNKNLFHICPSLAEGWGHYIYESLSCGSVCVISNSYPMNEYIPKECCVYVDGKFDIDRNEFSCKYNMKRFPLRTCFFVNEFLNDSINKLLSLTDSQLNQISKNAREFYLLSDNQFKKSLSSIF